MSGRLRRIALITLIAACSCALCFAAVSIVSPSVDAVVESDSVLISVKMTQKQTVLINMYRLFVQTPEQDGSAGSAENGADGSGCIPLSSEKLGAADMALISAQAEVDASGQAICLSDGTPMQKFAEEAYIDEITYSNELEVGFYTKQISGVEPGVYRICVDVKDSEEGESVCICVKEKKPDVIADSSLFEKPGFGSAILQFIQKLFKSLFGR